MVKNVINEKYLNQDYRNPKYIFHGSSLLLEVLNPQTAHDTNNNVSNQQTAIYGSSIFKGAVPYAIKGKGKYDCEIGYHLDDLRMKITYGIIPEDEEGYVYVCDAKDFTQCNDTCQYVAYKPIKPIEIIKIKYKDFKDCFIYINDI